MQFYLYNIHSDERRWVCHLTLLVRQSQTQKLNAHSCKEQLKQLNRCSNLLPCTHQADIRLRAKHFATKAVQFLQSFFVFDLPSCSSYRHWRNLSIILQRAAKNSMGSDLEMAKPTGASSWDENSAQAIVYWRMLVNSLWMCGSTASRWKAALCLSSSTWIKLKHIRGLII